MSYKGYAQAADTVTALMNTHNVNVVIIDGPAQRECALEIIPFLAQTSSVFVRNWDKGVSAEDKEAVLEHYAIGKVVKGSGEFGEPRNTDQATWCTCYDS